MAKELWIGGMSEVIIDEAGGDFATPLITLTEFTAEGNTWPKPVTKKTGIYGGQSAPVGEESGPVVMMAKNVDPAEAATVRSRGFDLDECDLKFTSIDGTVVRYLRGVIVHVSMQPLADEGNLGIVMFELQKTNYGTTGVLETS